MDNGKGLYIFITQAQLTVRVIVARARLLGYRSFPTVTTRLQERL